MTAQEQIGLLRFSTAGSVDDGKSTLIGRLLFDSKQVFEDQLEALERSSDLTGGGKINLANLTDGLRAEREQGITIDVAYRYFATARRRFIVADTPGHIQYTRNMVTGASTAHAALVLIDARNGVSEQTRRHAYISSMLRVPQLVVCVNKMDLVQFSQEIFEKVKKDFLTFSEGLAFLGITFIPISALLGDNVVEPSSNMGWYRGPSLLNYLEGLDVEEPAFGAFRLPIQRVIRPVGATDFHDFRGFSGQIVGGELKLGDEVMVLPGGHYSRVKQIHTPKGVLECAQEKMSISVLLEDNIDVGRGDMFVHPNQLPTIASEFRATLCWMSEQPMQLGATYTIKHLTKITRCYVTEIESVIDMHTMTSSGPQKSLALNDIAKIRIKTMAPLFFDSYERNKSTGAFILIEEATNDTVAAGMIYV